ncbi:hypothetical protein ACFLX7_03380 [Chloroflexota bacterium]
MVDKIEKRYHQWTQGLEELPARISIYSRVRDIPYAVVPELNSTEKYGDILKYGRGSCMPKHFLLCNMYQRLGMLVLFVVYPFRWDEMGINFPPHLKKLAKAMPASYHLACKAEIEGNLVLVDVTLDPALERLGLPVNKEWDGLSNTLLPVIPCGEEEVHYPTEILFEQTPYDENTMAFYRELNQWFDEVRTY